MGKASGSIDKVRASRAGHTFHERWTARRALQLVFPKDNLFAIVVEGLSADEHLKLGKEAEDIADLTLFYGNGDTFKTCISQQILQFKYKAATQPVTASYLKKTIKKFAATFREFNVSVSKADVMKKLSFGFVTNAKFSDDLWDAIACLKTGGNPKTQGAKIQFRNLNTWCNEEEVEGGLIFPLIEFCAATNNLPAQNRHLRRMVSDWSAGSTGQAAKRLFALVELVREKAQIEGQNNNSIRREDVLDALECDVDQLFPADTRFPDVGKVVERTNLQDIKNEIEACNLPVVLHADGGVGKTVFIQSLAAHLRDSYEVVIFDCFGGGAYRSEAQARHTPKVGLLQLINELATRGLCDPLLPTDSDQYGLINVARKRLKQASETVHNQSVMQGVLIVLDAADNAQLEANARNELSFPRLILASLSAEPIDGVKLLLTSRPHRMDTFIGNSETKRLMLEPFTEEETREFLATRRCAITDLEFSTAFSRSQGNARVLEYLVESWDVNVSGNAPQTEVSVEALIAEKCGRIFRGLYTAGWTEIEVRKFFAALSLLPPPIPLGDLAKALGWSASQVNSAASDLAPMLELVKHGVIFRDEPTETYIKEQYANEISAQQSIAQRLQAQQKSSIYAAEALPHFLTVIGDSYRAYQLADSDEFPTQIESEYERRRLKLARLYSAFFLATRDQDLDRALSLSMKLSQVASANARGDQFIRRSPALATILGGSDASRRLFNDRSGWRGARDARLVIAHCFSDELDEARIHQNRAIGWINWYLRTDDETELFERSRLEAAHLAAVMFLSILDGEFSSFNRNIQLWRFKFALAVIEEILTLCSQHQVSNGSEALHNLASFAASKQCRSLTLQIGLLSNECGLSTSQLRAISRAASSLSLKVNHNVSEDSSDFEMELQGAIASAAINSLILNSKQSAKRLLKLARHRRPSSYDYGARHGVNRVWIPVLSACVTAWSSSNELSFRHLVPEGVTGSRKINSIVSAADLSEFLDSLTETTNQNNGRMVGKAVERKQFSSREQNEIVKGATCILELVKPIEMVVLSKTELSNDTLADFLDVWKSNLRPGIHWSAEIGRDHIARQVGIELAKILLRHCKTIGKNEAEQLAELIRANRFSRSDKLCILALISQRPNLCDLAGEYADKISKDIVEDDDIEQRGEAYRGLAASLIPMSISEAKAYYAKGLAQLDQMGGNDFELIYSILHYAAEQPGGFVKPQLSHRLMNLCQTIFQDEPSKFGWLLFGRAAASSIGFPAMYKLIRWDDQDVVDYSYGLPQLACYLAKAGYLDARRAAVLLTICKDHGWHEWQVGKGVHELLLIADSKDRSAIFNLVVKKLDQEHSFGGWEGLWESLLESVDAFEEINQSGLRGHLQEQLESTRRRRITNSIESNYTSLGAEYQAQLECKKINEHSRKNAFATIIAKCDPTSTSSLNEAIQESRTIDGSAFDNRNYLFRELRNVCPYDERVNFLKALCEADELEFDPTLDLIVECVTDWATSSAHVKTSTADLIRRLFASKGSKLFELRYSGITRQIYRLSKLCDDPKFVLRTVMETIAKERLALSGDEWLQLATSLSCHTDPATALKSFEDLLSSPAANVGDEVGEGAYRTMFAGQRDEGDVVADVIWHLLGHSDAFVRWNTARSLKGMLEVGLTEDIERLLDLFDKNENLSLASNEHHFAFLNAQQWLLMGLARAALYHGDKLKPLKSKIASLAKRQDIHLLNKLHLARCLKHIEGRGSLSAQLTQLFTEVQIPPHGTVERNSPRQSTGSRFDFGFEYEFKEHKISNLAQLFWISNNEASDYVADEIVKRWPGATKMADFPGRIRYRGDNRFETYPEHIQKHALIHAATTLVKAMPVAQRSSDCESLCPWQEFIKCEDVSFEDGSWLSDHKDLVPKQAMERLLRKRNGNEQKLLDREVLFQKVGFTEGVKGHLVPLYGHWTSPDGVRVSLTPAIVMERGAVGQSVKLSKARFHDLWLPRFGGDGRVDRHIKRGPFTPLIWDPDNYPIGIDEHDEWATRDVIGRPKLGRTLNTLLELTSDEDERCWYDNTGELVLKSDVWGEWRVNSESHRSRYQDEGDILWAEVDWLDGVLESYKRSLVFRLEFSKYKSDTSYDQSSGLRELYVCLKRSGEQPRFWFAREASKTVY